VSAGVIQGKVLSGDGVTPIPFAPVHFQSRSVLFGRVFNVTADVSGAFEFRARTDGSYSALPLPLYTFDIDARHPKTGASTSNTVGGTTAAGGGSSEPHLNAREPARHGHPPLRRLVEAPS
jgi:hypothetical protein